MNRFVSRRNILRGAGIALALPWMESLAPRHALAQATVRKRFLPIFLPNGAAELWKPLNPGVDAGWNLSSVLDPLAPLKAKVTVLTNLENGTSFNADGGSSVEPSHGRQPAAWLACRDPAGMQNLMSVDQRIAKFLGTAAPMPSLQVGLSTTASFCDNNPCANSRSVSWSEANVPLYKTIDPLEVFNKLIGFATPDQPDTGPDPEALKRIALNKSVLDTVISNTNISRAKLGKADQDRLDMFLTSVREVEKKATGVSAGMGGLACTPIAKPTMGSATDPINNNDYARQNSDKYNKGKHAEIMNDLIVMAFQCDATRVISYMLEDERSEFVYDHVTRRNFTETGSTETTGKCPEYHTGGQHNSQMDFATITWWNVAQVAALCGKLDAIVEENGKTLLDNTLVLFGGAMHGSNHACNQLPTALIGSGGGTFKTNMHVDLGNRWLRDLHYTIMTDMYGMSGPDVESFGAVRANKPMTKISEILAG